VYNTILVTVELTYPTTETLYLLIIKFPFSLQKSWANVILVCTFMSSYCLSPHVSEIMQDLSLCVWFISLNIMFSTFTHVVTNDRTSFFLRLNNIPLCVYHIFFTHLTTSGHLGYFCILVIVNNATMTIEVKISL
jgi:hypothetical protein